MSDEFGIDNIMRREVKVLLRVCLVFGVLCASMDEAAASPFIRADANSDGKVDITDPVFLLDYLFRGGDSPPCFDAADSDDSGSINITDATYILGYLFLGGQQPVTPFPSCGDDITDDTLSCIRTSSCIEPDDEEGSRVYVYLEDGLPGDFLPSGWIPDGQGIVQDSLNTDTPNTPPNCIRLKCKLSMIPWTGIYFLLDGTWQPKRVFNLFERLGASPGDSIKCRFWARSPDAAVVQIKVGGVSDGLIKDSVLPAVASSWIPLNSSWMRYEIDLTGQDLSSMVGGFVWVVDRANNGARDFQFDLDTIYFVRVRG